MIKGTMNPAATIFTLKNVAGWRDKTDHNMAGDVTLNIVNYDKI
jgi:hypothetical protein